MFLYEEFRKVRRMKDITQNELGKFLGKGQGWVSMMEKGKINLTLERAEKIAEFLGMEVSITISEKEVALCKS